jgi:hypothetical protein
LYCDLQYNLGMREALIIRSGGEHFRFYFDRRLPEVLHITFQHGTTPEDAIRTFFEGTTTHWSEVHQRFETVTETHVLYWTRHAHDESVIVISCFSRGDD